MSVNAFVAHLMSQPIDGNAWLNVSWYVWGCTMVTNIWGRHQVNIQMLLRWTLMYSQVFPMNVTNGFFVCVCMGNSCVLFFEILNSNFWFLNFWNWVIGFWLCHTSLELGSCKCQDIGCQYCLLTRWQKHRLHFSCISSFP